MMASFSVPAPITLAAVMDVSGDQGKILWHNKELRNHFNSSVLFQGDLYGFDGNNILSTGLKCVDFATGKLKWNVEKPNWGNLIIAGDRLIIVSQSFDLIIARASGEKYEELAQCHPMGGNAGLRRCWRMGFYICGIRGGIGGV